MAERKGQLQITHVKSGRSGYWKVPVLPLARTGNLKNIQELVAREEYREWCWAVAKLRSEYGVEMAGIWAPEYYEAELVKVPVPVVRSIWFRELSETDPVMRVARLGKELYRLDRPAPPRFRMAQLQPLHPRYRGQRCGYLGWRAQVLAWWILFASASAKIYVPPRPWALLMSRLEQGYLRLADWRYAVQCYEAISSKRIATGRRLAYEKLSPFRVDLRLGGKLQLVRR